MLPSPHNMLHWRTHKLRCLKHCVDKNAKERESTLQQALQSPDTEERRCNSEGSMYRMESVNVTMGPLTGL